MRIVGLATLLVAACALGCSRSAPAPALPGEDGAAAPPGGPAVPAPVQDAAARILRRLGRNVTCAEWSLSAEDTVWECSLAGLGRSAALDVDLAGRFVELDFVMGLSEIEQAVPAAAAAIADGCRDRRPAAAELSIRAEPLVGSEPHLARLWGEDRVFLEVACLDGSRFELDAFGTVVPGAAHDAGGAPE